MAKKKPAAAVPASKPVMQGQVFVTFIAEAREMVAELMARRQFDADAAAFLKERGLTDAFSAWRDARAAAPKV